MTVTVKNNDKISRPRLKVDWEKANESAAARLKLARNLFDKSSDVSQDLQYRLDALQQAVRLDPFQLSYRLALAEMEKKAGLFDSAAGTYRACLAYRPGNRLVTMLLAETLLEYGKTGEARNLLQSALAGMPDGAEAKAEESGGAAGQETLLRLQFGLIECDLREGKWQDAMDALQKNEFPGVWDAAWTFYEKCIKIALENTDRALLDRLLALADEKYPEGVCVDLDSQDGEGEERMPLIRMRGLLAEVAAFDPERTIDLPAMDDLNTMLYCFKLEQHLPLAAGDSLTGLAAWKKRLNAPDSPDALSDAYIALLDDWAQKAYRHKKMDIADLLWTEAERLRPFQPEVIQNLAILRTRMKDEEGYRWYWDKADRVWALHGEAVPQADGYRQNLIQKHLAFMQGAQAKCPAIQDQQELLELGAIWAREAACYFALAQLEFRNPYYRLGLRKSDFSGDEERDQAIRDAHQTMSDRLKLVAGWEGLGQQSALVQWRERSLEDAVKLLTGNSPSMQFYEEERKAFSAMRDLMAGQYLHLLFRLVLPLSEQVSPEDAPAIKNYAMLVSGVLVFPHELLKPDVLKAVEQLKPETDLTALVHNRAAAPWVNAAQGFMEKKETVKAESILMHMLEVMPRYVPGMFLLARCLEDRNEYDGAYKLMEQAAKLIRPADEWAGHVDGFRQKLDIERVSSRLDKARALIEKEDAEGAVAECKNAFVQYPEHPYVLFILAQAYLLRADIVLAKSALVRADKACRDNPELREAIGKNLQQIREHGAGIILSKAVPEMKDGHWQAAVDYLDKGKTLKPPDARVLFYKAVCLTRLKQKTAAQECAKKALELAKDDSGLTREIKAFIPQIKTSVIADELENARLSMNIENWKQALVYLRQAEKTAPFTAIVSYYTAICLFRSDELDEAERSMKLALHLCEDDIGEESEHIRSQMEQMRKALPQARQNLRMKPVIEAIDKEQYDFAILMLDRIFSESLTQEPEILYLRAMCRFRSTMKDINSRSVTPASSLFNGAIADLKQVIRYGDYAVTKQAESLMDNINTVLEQLRSAGYY